jgi:membrane protease YdiL (CAAX protease family)
MDQPPLVTPVSVLVLFGLAIWAAMAVWATVYRRWRAGLPLLPLRPRRQVPWRGVDMAMILVVYIASMSGAARLARLVLGSEACQPLPITPADDPNAHVVVQLFLRGGVWTMIACIAAAAVVAPLAEEILFRLFLQGWLESLDRRLGPFMPTLRRWVRWGTLPVVVSSLLFAMAHVRVDPKQYGVDFLRFMMIALAVGALATVAFALALARLARGATAADLGFVRAKILPDVGLGLAAFGGIAAPLFAVQLMLGRLLPSYVAADPFTLFPFALVLGTLYCRTHRIVPAIVLHAALNTTSLILLWLQMLSQGAA